jgi:hypothetical protein
LDRREAVGGGPAVLVGWTELYPPVVTIRFGLRLAVMAVSGLEFGDSLAGLLVDGVEETPYTGATLKMRAGDGVVVEVPYLRVE